MLSLWKTVITLVAVLTIPVFAYSDTIVVPDDHPTIQGAIDASVNGDTVLVKPGTYVENIDFIGKAITVISKSGPCFTEIDGNGADSTVTFRNGEGADSVLSGFTVTNGYAFDGGGIFCDSSPVITNNIISGNRASHYGGGICCGIGHSPTVTDNIITDNLASGVDGGWGGGIFCDYSSPKISNNIIWGNTSKTGGGGIHSFHSSPNITNNLILSNSANYHGGGIHCAYSSPAITNNTFFGNSAKYGGGINCLADSSLTITNTILWNNSATYGPEISVKQYMSNPSTLTISYSDVEGGQSLVYVEHGCTLNWDSCMIDSDPLFVDPDNEDYHLTFNSPCRGSGDNSCVTELYDFEGDPRICQGTVDIGADECYRHLYCMGDFTPGGAIEGKFIGLPGTTPVGLFLSAGTLPSPMPTMWGNFHLQFPVYLVELGPIPADGVMVLTTILPGSIPAPYDVPMQALIGLSPDSLTNLCVLEVR